MLLAQTTTTTVPMEIETSRPLTDFLVDLFRLDRESVTAGLLGRVIEPILQVVLIVLLAWLVARVLRRLAKRAVRRLKERDGPGPLTVGLGDGPPVRSTRRSLRLDSLGAVATSGIGVIVWAVALFTILSATFGLNVGPLVAGAGILGIALGFGAQDLVKDVLSGMFMLAEDQFGVGDVVDAGEAIGVVEGLGLRTTRLRDVTGTLWHIPNGEIRRVGNMSQEWSRALLDIGVAYDSDVDGAAEVIKGVADSMAAEETYQSLFLEAPEIWGVEALSADSVDIRLVVKTRPGEQWAICRELRRRIKLALDEAEIEIPFAQRTVWLRSGDEPHPAASLGRDPAAPSVASGKAAPEEGAEVTVEGGDQPT